MSEGMRAWLWADFETGEKHWLPHDPGTSIAVEFVIATRLAEVEAERDRLREINFANVMEIDNLKMELDACLPTHDDVRGILREEAAVTPDDFPTAEAYAKWYWARQARWWGKAFVICVALGLILPLFGVGCVAHFP